MFELIDILEKRVSDLESKLESCEGRVSDLENKIKQSEKNSNPTPKATAKSKTLPDGGSF